MSVYENLKEHGIELPKQLAAAGLYKPVNRTGNLVFISGQGSMVNDTKITGRVGADLSVEEGAAAVVTMDGDIHDDLENTGGVSGGSEQGEALREDLRFCSQRG